MAALRETHNPKESEHRPAPKAIDCYQFGPHDLLYLLKGAKEFPEKKMTLEWLRGYDALVFLTPFLSL